MGKYYVRFNRSGRYLWGLLYSFFFIIITINTASAADTLSCSGPGVSAISGVTSSAPTCEAKNNNGTGTWVVDNPNWQGPFYVWNCKKVENGGIVTGGSCTKSQSKCTAGDVPPAGNFDGKPYWAFSGKNLGNSICLDECVATGEWDGNMKTGDSWSTFFKGSMKITGQECTPPTDDQKEGGDCGPNSGSVTINGTKRCVPNGDQNDPNNESSKPKPKTTTKTSTDCSILNLCVTTETKTETKNTPNGGTEETTTTTTTSRDADGNVTGTTTSTSKTIKDKGNLDNSNDPSDKDDKETKDLCEKNPTLTICKNSTISGECGNTTCDGDAITCAIIKLQRKNDCEVREDTPEKVLGRQIAADNDPLKANLPSPNNAQNIDFSQLNLSAEGWGFGGACIQDKSISVMGKTVTIPFSSICDFLLALRAGIMLLAGLLSFKIVSGVILTV